MISQPFYANSTSSIIFVVVDQKKQNTQRTEPFLGLGDGGRAVVSRSFKTFFGE